MLYIAVVTLTMLVLPAISIPVELLISGAAPFMWLVGKWFVFWGVGLRLMLAGIRQSLKPSFTAREIFHIESDDVLPLIRELGISNIAIGILGIVSIHATSFVLPVAIYSTIFYGAAGVAHLREANRSRNETIAMASDLFIAAVLTGFVVWSAIAA